LKELLKKYSAFVVKALAPLGPWGVFVGAILDAAAYGLPVDAIVAGYVYARPQWLPVYVFMAATGSALGSLVVYFIGLKGGELLLSKRVSEQRMNELRDRFEKQEFLAVMVPAFLPPPTPYKLFILAAGVFRMRPPTLLLAVFVGRTIRFFALGLLVRYLGPEIVHATGTLLHAHLWLTLGIFALLILLWVYIKVRRSGSSKGGS